MTLSEKRALAGRKGGSRRTERKLAALHALHASRRGKRLSRASAARDDVLARARDVLRDPVPGRSARALAAWCGVSDMTVRRWLAGDDWPGMEQVKRIAVWVAAVSKTPPRPPSEQAPGSA
jgi:hypothetical protein